ncbi:hypothetical protein [Polaribacter cellanae]|uniref:Uncharacterized protein n=1 Tax=Polaribacter cellanae TaxID=2818493 RepID=A0A975CN20_9FLAO|nr:hypothetical protein [Polaribacter cellanae]QTE21545.1 hypothetical protein J3359_12005 [Polaribacter cellanae]
MQQVKELLKAIPHEELMQFVQENSKKDPKFRNYFLASFGHLSQNQSKEFYQKQIHSILQTAAGRDGWIGWSDMKYVVNTTEPFLQNARKYLANNNFENVFYISTALLEEIIEAFQYADDSNGNLGYFIESAIELLSNLIQEKISKNLKEKIFEYCIATFKQKLFEGWGWHLEMLNIAFELVNKESDVAIILDCIDTIDGKYEQERAQLFKLKVLRRFKSEDDVKKYIQKHISNSSIRKQEIEKAFKNKNFNRVINLCQDGIKCDLKDKPGLVKVWYNWLLKVAQLQNETSKIIEYARFLFIDNFHPEQDYYQILKNTIEGKKWHPFLEEIIKEITPKSNWTYTELLRKIYIKEEWWDRLFLMLKQNISLENIKQNESYLSKDYAPELIEFYRERITNYVEKYIGRNHYQTACKYLRRMKKLGGNRQVDELIELFKKQYPQRRALIDELSRV